MTDQPTSSDGGTPNETRTFIPVGKDYFSLSDDQKRAVIRQWLNGIRVQLRKPDAPADTDAPSGAPTASEEMPAPDGEGD